MNLFVKLYNRIKLTLLAVTSVKARIYLSVLCGKTSFAPLAPARLFGGVKPLSAPCGKISLRPLRLPAVAFAKAGLIFAFFAVILLSTTAHAQTTPVQANLNITAPYPVNLGQYASPINDKLNLTLLFKDQSVGTVDVLFRLSIQGPGGINIQTNPSYRGTPVTLQALLPEQLTGYDLAPYFALENLIFSGGLTKSEYQRTGALPEGFYNFKLQVVHARRTNVVISNTALAPAWLTYSDPPFINLPTCGAQIELVEPQYIQFQWMPMHLSSPLAINTEYLLEIVEIRPKERNPNDAMLSTRPIFETTTTSPTYFYGPADPPLIPGMYYAFRVKVLDPDGNLFFKNQGYSVVSHFTYGQENNLLPPDDIAVKLEREKLVRVTWEPRVEASSYKVAYKFADEADAPWHYIETAGSSAIINDLGYNKAYNFKVQSLFGPYASEWGTPQMATTLPPQEYVCNTETLPALPTNRIPLQFLGPYDKVQVGNFEMEVLKVTSGNGLYSGLGSIYNPQWGITFKVYFKNIAINELYQLTDGTVHVETEGAAAYIAEFEDSLDAADSIPTDDEPIDTDTDINIPQDTITIDGVIDSVYVNPTTGDIVVITDDGEETTYEQEVNDEGEKENTLITDSQGNSWVVDKEGNVSGGGGMGGSGTGTNTNTQLALLEKLLLEILDEFDKEITQWLAVNGKGPLDETEMRWLLNLPECLPQDEEALTYLQEVRMPEIENDIIAFIENINEDEDHKAIIENLVQGKSENQPLKEQLTLEQWEEGKGVVCGNLFEDVCIAPRPELTGFEREGQFTTTSCFTGALGISEHKVSWYYYTGYLGQSQPLRINGQIALSGWYKESDYIELIQPIIVAYIVVMGEVEIHFDQYGEVYETYLILLEEFNDADLSDDYLSAQKKGYAKALEHAENQLTGSGKVLPSYPIYEVLSLFTAKQVLTGAIKFGNALRQLSRVKNLITYSTKGAGLKVVAKETGQEIGEITITGKIKPIALLDEGDELLRTVDGDLLLKSGKKIGWKKLVQTRLFKVGDDIIGIKVKQVKKGSNGKYALIGRSMGNSEITGVKNVYSELKNAQKLDVEIFDSSSLSGIWRTDFDEALTEFAQKTNNWTKKLTNQELLQLKMYKLNKRWAQKLVNEGYTILDLGDFNNLGFSAFYSMEKTTIFK